MLALSVPDDGYSISRVVLTIYIYMNTTVCFNDNTTWQDRIRNEIIQMKHSGMYSVGNLQLESFRDLKMFVCECLRMHPPELLTRRVTQSFTLDGHVIPVGTLIDIDLFSLHRNPLY